MNTPKRLKNTLQIRVKFFPATNHKNNRLKFIQSNNKKNVTIDQADNLEPLDFICSIFEGIESIKNYALIVNNLDNDYHFQIDYYNNSFPNIIQEIKN